MKTFVTIAGMRGDHCKRALFTALTPVAGIRSVDVALGRIAVEHDGTVSEAALRDAISVTGYVVASVVEDRRTLPILDAVLQTHSI